MNAVVYAVKASYVASTKHKGRQVRAGEVFPEKDLMVFTTYVKYTCTQ